MREWSPRARRLLARATYEPRATAWFGFRARLAQLDMPLTPALQTFHDQLDGQTYHVRGTNGQMHFRLGPYSDIVTDDTGRVHLECGDHDIAQFLFYLDLEGKLAVGDGDNAPRVIASSGAAYVEAEAVIDELADFQPAWYQIFLGEVTSADRRVDERLPLPIMPEASDEYTTWWGDNRRRVKRHVLWGAEPVRDRIVGYTRTREEAAQLIAVLGDVTARGAPTIEMWP